MFAVCILFGAGGCARRPNVLLVTFDTTRADHVGYATGRADRTPTLNRLAANGTWFSTCLTSAPVTLPAHASLLTGLDPPHHRVRDNGSFHLSPNVPTLATWLRGAGYATHAIVSAFVLDSRFGLSEGFDQYDDDLSMGVRDQLFTYREIKATQTADKAIRWLRDERPVSQPFFLWVHFFDPHWFYDPPADVAARFPGDPYSAEIQYADRELGRLIDTLRGLGLEKKTLVAFASDHGESLGEHGEKTHGVFVYEATTRVPLLFEGPGVPAGKRVDALSRLVDVAPTLLDFLGMRPPAALDGQSLRALWAGKDDHRTAYIESFLPRLDLGWAELRALRNERMKVIQAPREEVYDPVRDPGEKVNLAGRPAVTESSMALLRNLAQISSKDPPARVGALKMDSETRGKLASLSYLTGLVDPSQVEYADPKDKVQLLAEITEAEQLVQDEHVAEAIGRLNDIVARNPGNIVVLGALAEAYRQQADRARAIEVREKIFARAPRLTSNTTTLATLLRETGELDRAEEFSKQVIAQEPENSDALVELGEIEYRRGNDTKAATWFRAASDAEPYSSPAAFGLARSESRMGDLAGAQAVLRAARARNATDHRLAFGLAVVTEKLGDLKGAAELYREAVRLAPGHSMSWNNLGSVSQRLGQKAEADRCYTKALALDAENVEAAFNLGLLRLSEGDATGALPLLEKAVQARPELHQASLLRARALESLGRDAEATQILRALQGRPAADWIGFARLELTLGRSDDARKDLREAIRLGGEETRLYAGRDKALRSLLEPS